MLPFQQQPDIAFGESLSKENAIKLHICFCSFLITFIKEKKVYKENVDCVFHPVLHLVFQNEQVNN